LGEIVTTIPTIGKIKANKKKTTHYVFRNVTRCRF